MEQMISQGRRADDGTRPTDVCEHSGCSRSRGPYPPSEWACITWEAMKEMLSEIGSRPAESGGLLLGPIGRDGISDFHFDASADTHRMTYSPSYGELTTLCEAASEKGYELKGFGHSHPGLPHPSQGDMTYVAQFFAANPSMSKFYMPILPSVPITRGFTASADRKDWQELVRFHVVTRDSMSEHREVPIHVCEETLFPTVGAECISPPDGAHYLASRLSGMLGDIVVTPSTVEAEGKSISCLEAVFADRRVLVMLPREFPVLSPTVVLFDDRFGESQLQFLWRIDDNRLAEVRLGHLIMAASAYCPDTF